MCKDAPCHRLQFEDILRSKGAILLGDNSALNAARHRLYSRYIMAVHGILGFRNCRVVPACVRDFIRELFPDAGGDYVGHIDAVAQDDDT